MSSLSAAATAVFSKLDVTPAEVAAEVKESGACEVAYYYWETMLHEYFSEEEVCEVFEEVA